MGDSYKPKRHYTKKVKMSYILKPGCTIKDLKYNSENLDPKRRNYLIEKTKKIQKKILKQKEIDWNQLERTVITI